ncbi:DUF3054 domain-containing protein [Paenarthrobacter sp. PH39-S1]|uniref:DUF3054 domain-containing protein n=1 Tax=Paenarthrobacter sp. PH39-S1 TaxID=3046204 RepID=UPI0024BAFAE9|nr:DUF3054 domain-containing protein [Paenarthrobacter sp. PH39-S1]MDJ0357461.1 DUF3054 domain-containing protein [Paenarthrobacter sp. PH39-S1]
MTETRKTSNPPVSRGIVIYAAAADLIVVLVFAATGRASHAETHPLLGVLTTAWPFLAGLVVGWATSRAWRAPLRLWPHGVAVWAVTVAAGMVLRLLSGQTAQLPFVVVALVVLAVFLLGHRALAGLVRRRMNHDSGHAVLR